MFSSHSGCAVLEGSDWGMGGGWGNELVCRLCINQNIVILSFRLTVGYWSHIREQTGSGVTKAVVFFDYIIYIRLNMPLSRFNLNSSPSVGSVVWIHVVSCCFELFTSASIVKIIAWIVLKNLVPYALLILCYDCRTLLLGIFAI